RQAHRRRRGSGSRGSPEVLRRPLRTCTAVSCGFRPIPLIGRATNCFIGCPLNSIRRMTSRATGKRVRKTPAEPRSEIVASAARSGLTEGLECVPLRRVADELGVQPGLVGHYFPAADELVAEAFTHATMRELDGLLPPEPDGPLHTFRRFF